jgi:hypothetical protein
MHDQASLPGTAPHFPLGAGALTALKPLVESCACVRGCGGGSGVLSLASRVVVCFCSSAHTVEREYLSYRTLLMSVTSEWKLSPQTSIPK